MLHYLPIYNMAEMPRSIEFSSLVEFTCACYFFNFLIAKQKQWLGVTRRGKGSTPMSHYSKQPNHFHRKLISCTVKNLCYGGCQ